MKWLRKVKKIKLSTIKELAIKDDGNTIKVNIYDFNGNLIGLRTRNVKNNEQWRQQSDTPAFPFNHQNINLSKPLFIAEGETSSLTIYDLISKNVIGTPGMCFKESWATHFKDVPKIYIIPDNNKPGSDLVNRIKLAFSKFNKPCKVINVPRKYIDISEFYIQTDAETLKSWWLKKHRKRKLLSKEEQQIKDPYIFGYSNFVEHGTEITDAPISFFEGLALIALSTILSHKIKWTGTSVMSELKPNLAVILAADSTRARKTESLKILENLIIGLDEEAAILPQYFSPEALIKVVAERDGRNSLLLMDEIGRFLEGIITKKYMAGAKEILIRLLGGRLRTIKKQTISHGKVAIYDPCLTAIGTATIESLRTSLDVRDLLSGFSSRFLFIAPEKFRPRKSLVVFRRDNSKNLLDVFQKIKENSEEKISYVSMSYKTKGMKKKDITSTAPPYFVEFENEDVLIRFDRFEAQMEELDIEKPWFNPMHTRLAWTTLKAATLLAAADFFKSKPKTTTIKISNEILIYCIKLAEKKWLTSQKFIIGQIGSSKFDLIIDQIAKFVKGESKSRSEIMRRFSLSARDTNEIRDTMLQRGLIEIVAEKSRGVKKIEIWSES